MGFSPSRNAYDEIAATLYRSHVTVQEKSGGVPVDEPENIILPKRFYTDSSPLTLLLELLPNCSISCPIC